MKLFILPALLLSSHAYAADHPWKLETVQDKLTLASAQHLTFPGDGGDLVLICSLGSSKVRFVATSQEFLGSSRHQYIEYRIGAYLSKRGEMWRYSNNNAAEPWDNKELRAIMNALANAEEAVFRFTRYDNGKITVTYRLPEVGIALKAWGESCALPGFDQIRTDPG